MSRLDIVTRKLTEVSDEEWEVVLACCQQLINERTKSKTQFGAHSEEKLGASPFEYYFQSALDKLYEGVWDWKFEKYSLAEQMTRMIGSIISENVRKYRKEIKDREEGTSTIPTFVSFEEFEFLASVDPEEESDQEEMDKKIEAQLKIIEQAVNGDEDLENLYLLLIDGKSNDEICEALGWEKRKLYKTVERLRTKARNFNSQH